MDNVKCETCRDLGYVYAYQDNNIPCPDCKGNKKTREKKKTFMRAYLDNEIPLEKIDDYIDEWHNTDTESLHEYLGMTELEYRTYVCNYEHFKRYMKIKKENKE